MAMPGFHVPSARTDLRRRVAMMWSAYSGRDLLENAPASSRTSLASIEQLAGVRAPTLILLGDTDAALFRRIADTLAVRIKGAERREVRGGGHLVHMLEPARFNSAVMPFLTKVDQRR
jgi:pimeloyl-ACP methyl ester carboxylesterase